VTGKNVEIVEGSVRGASIIQRLVKGCDEGCVLDTVSLVAGFYVVVVNHEIDPRFSPLE